jgi:hypothetical protein
MHVRPKIAHLSGEFRYLAVSQYIDIGMSTDIQQLRRQNSYSAIVGGKRLIQHGHFPAYAGVFFHQVDANTHFGEIQSRLHPGYSASDDENFV